MDIVNEIKKIPPVTRFLCLATAGVTGAVGLHLLDIYWIFYHTDFVIQKFQVWRVFTSFLFGRPSLSFIFDLVMLYRALNDLESRAYDRRSSDLAYQLLLLTPTILAATFFKSPLPFKSLLLSIVYLYSRLTPTGMTSIMGLVQLPIAYQPFIMIVFDLLSAGKSEAMLDVVGCVVGHIWWWTVWGDDSTGRGLLSAFAKAPEWLRKWMGEHGPHVDSAARPVAGGVYVSSPRGTTTARSGGSGYQWGTGRRLAPPNSSWSFGHRVDSVPEGKAWVEGENKGWTVVDTSKTDPGRVYQISIAGIVPRPIAFVSSISEDGLCNLGLFSWFNQVSSEPPVLSISILNRPDREKDSLRNIKETKGFTVNIISEAWVEQANAASVNAPYGFSEWELTGLTKVDSIHVKAPRVKECAFSMECELLQAIDIVDPNKENKVTSTLVLGTIKVIHMRNDILNEAGLPDIGKLKPVSRISSSLYGRVTSVFPLPNLMAAWKDLHENVL